MEAIAEKHRQANTLLNKIWLWGSNHPMVMTFGRKISTLLLRRFSKCPGVGILSGLLFCFGNLRNRHLNLYRNFGINRRRVFQREYFCGRSPRNHWNVKHGNTITAVMSTLMSPTKCQNPDNIFATIWNPRRNFRFMVWLDFDMMDAVIFHCEGNMRPPIIWMFHFEHILIVL